MYAAFGPHDCGISQSLHALILDILQSRLGQNAEDKLRDQMRMLIASKGTYHEF